MTDCWWLLLIPLAPLLGAAYNGLLGCRLQRRFGRAAVHFPAIALPALSFAVTVAAFCKLAALPHHDRILHCYLWDWLVVGRLDASLAFLMDPLTLVMCVVVTFVGTLIHVYSVGYMHDDPSYWRFFCYLNLFMFAMLVLVLADNFVLLFVGWEGVGLCSYLLIGFWYREPKNAVAGMKAFVVNRVGDFGFLLGLLLLFWALQGTWTDGRFDALPAAATPAAAPVESVTHAEAATTAGGPSVTFHRLEAHLADPETLRSLTSRRLLGCSLMTVIGILFFVGAMGKSAQIPLYVWLPDAMAGPTPVSALIHAATMVTAGVYMVARLHFIFAMSPLLMTWVAVVGALTAVFAASIALFQHDIKKVLAYSTVSQLGFMFIAVGVGAYWVGIFHLITHAFFKACLFLGSGSVILGCHHEQDMRRMGGLKQWMPTTAWTYFAACCAIAGFPLTAGFFSKDEILWRAFDAGNLILPGGGVLIWVLAAVAAIGTSYYMFRSYYLTFTGSYRGHSAAHDDAGAAHHHGPVHESPASMTSVLRVLGVLSLLAGIIGLPHLWHLPNYLHHWLEPVFAGSAAVIVGAGWGHGSEWALMLLSIVLALTGWWVARWLYAGARNPLPGRLLESPRGLLQTAYRVVYNKYYVDELYDRLVVRSVLRLRLLCDGCDRRLIDRTVNATSGIARGLAWLHRLTDVNVVDGLVNGTAHGVAWGGRVFRRLQSGDLTVYLYALVFGTAALVVLNYLMLA